MSRSSVRRTCSVPSAVFLLDQIMETSLHCRVEREQPRCVGHADTRDFRNATGSISSILGAVCISLLCHEATIIPVCCPPSAEPMVSGLGCRDLDGNNSWDITCNSGGPIQSKVGPKNLMLTVEAAFRAIFVLEAICAISVAA